MSHTPEQIDAAFQAANKYITSADSKDGPSLSNGDRLKFYGLFKQATQGPCSGKYIQLNHFTNFFRAQIGKQPGRMQIVARAKYGAWKALGSMSNDGAKMAFIELLAKLQPRFSPKL